MATDKLINSTQGDDIIEALSSIADNIENVPSSYEFSSAQVVSMVGYEKASEAGAISQADTLNVAAGKLEYKVDANNADIQSILDGTTIDSFGDVETSLADKADKDNVYRLALSDADLLPANTDLDNLKTVGCYYVLASATVPTITHRPTENSSAFRVTVEMAAGTIRPRQIYHEYNSYDTYIRAENSSEVWGGWKKVEGDLSTIYTKTEVDTALAGKQATLTTEQLSAVNSGIDSTKVGQIATNQSDISSLAANTVPKTRTINGNALSSDITLTAADVGAIPTTAKGTASGVAELDANGKVPTAQLPSYVDDVLEYASTSAFPATGETGKIYVDTTTNKTYRWGGSTYVEISASLALGDTSSTAYYGDKGKTAYDHATDSSRLTTATSSGLYKVASTAQGHIASLTSVEKADITALGIPGADTNTHRPIKVNSTQLLGDNTTALDIVAGSNVTLTPDTSTGKVTIAATDTTYSAATQSAAGLMSSTDKTKLDGIASGAQVNTITGVKGNSESTYRTGNVNITAANIGLGNVGNFKAVSTVASQGLSSTEQANARANIGAGTSSLTIGTSSTTAAAGNHTHNYAGSSSAGGAATSANKLNTNAGSATQPVYFSNGVPVATTYSLGKSVPSDAKFTDTTYSAATTSAAGLMSATDKSKLNGIATGAQVNSITGVKGNAESSYRTGNVNLTPANIGAAAASDVSGSTIAGGDLFTPSNGGTILSDGVLFKRGKHIFGVLGVTLNSTSGEIGSIKTSYLPSGDFVGIAHYMSSSTSWTLKSSLYIASSVNGMVSLYSSTYSVSSGTRIFLPIDYICK